MKFYLILAAIIYMKFFMNLSACEKCLYDMETTLDVMKNYHDFAETEHWKGYTKGLIQGLEMSCKIYNSNHNPEG